MTTSETTLLFEYVQRVPELKRIVAQQSEQLGDCKARRSELKAAVANLLERIGNLEAIAQALADELVEADQIAIHGIMYP